MKDNAQRLAIRQSLVNRGRGLLSLVPAIVLLAASTPAHGQTFANVPALSFVKHFAGPNPLPQTITVASTGSSFNFSASVSTSSGGNWLVLTGLGCGNTCGTTSRSATVAVNPDPSLSAGTYAGQITFASGSLRMIVPVTLSVRAVGTVHIEVVPGALSFSLKTSGVSPPSQSFQVHASGSSSLSWTLSTSTADGHSWLSVPLKSGVTPSAITASVDLAQLPGGGRTAGTFVGQIALSAATGNVTIPITVTVGDNVFEQIDPISFSKPFGGADPLPQVLTIASTGAAINFSASLSTGNGGDWLSVTGLGCGDTCGATPWVMTVSVNPVASLAAGIYTGEIIITSGSTAMSVPVTLTVVPNSQPSLDNLPGQISFSLVTGGVMPPVQPIQIRNAASAGTLAWTLTDTTADGGTWLTTTAASGTAPSTVMVGINPNALPNQGLVAGTFTGQLIVSTAAGVVTVPVSVTVAGTVFEQANAIGFTKPFGGPNPLPQVLTVASSGTASGFYASWSTGNGGDWLVVTGLGCGNTCGTTPRAITVSVNPNPSLPAGTYTGEIRITSSNAQMAMTIPVSLTIASSTQAFFDNLPGQLSFSFKTGAAAPPNQSFQIRNAGSGTLTWTASKSTSDGGAWLNLSTPSGTAPASVSVGINPSALPNQGLVAGTFTGQIVLTAPSGAATIPVTVTVGDSVFEQVNPISFTKLNGGANPLPQVLTIASTGDPIAFSASWSTANGGSWLSVTGLGCGNTCGTTPRALTVSVNPSASLAPGTYTGEIIIVSSSGSIPMTVPIVLTVAGTGQSAFDDLPGEISFSFLTNGANPPGQSLLIRNVGAGTLSWTAVESTSDGGAWLSVTPSSGTAASTVTVTVNKAALPNQGLVAGTFTGHVVLIGAGQAVSIPVSVVVDTTIFQQLPPIVFTKAPGGPNPASKTVTVSSLGNAVGFYGSWFAGNGGNWLSITGLGCGDTCGATPQVITASANTSGLAAGSYTGEIIFVSSTGSMSMTVPVYLTIGNPPPPPTTTSLTSSANPSTLGQSVTFTATVSGSNTNIPGSVVFKDGSSTLATVTLTNRVASFSTSALAVGTHSISAVYSGDSNNLGSSTQITQTVQPIAKPIPTTTLTSSLGPASIAGTPITFVAQVTHSGVTPTGTVTFKDGNTNLGTVSLVNGTASYATATLSAGVVHTITAVYNGDATYGGSTASLAQRVIYSLTVSLQTSANPSPSGHFVTITATLTSAGTGIAGYITFFDGGTPITAVYVSGNTRPLTLSNLSKGTHSVTAAYGGDYYHGGAFSSPLTQVVN